MELDNLLDVAKEENRMEIVLFAEKLKLHAKNEEEVFYPAAILVEEYLKLLNRSSYVHTICYLWLVRQ
jgi:hypothetical protein